ncbi:hypothetical protein BDY21DRAFT_368359 [Lineolata rhizophorae]|uniref:Uncharacterized protein n=1 Tax=Lineolata rhizophorae TaxID=578093 RepID=A0A6A6PEN2_9PEZI|nr:hypothetical protein BDY21DRAFT_368359 [Lineolata rhizophorae]
MPALDICTRAQILALKTNGISDNQIAEQTGVNKRTIYRVLKRATEAGYDPDATHRPITDAHVGGKGSAQPATNAGDEDTEDLV